MKPPVPDEQAKARQVARVRQAFQDSVRKPPIYLQLLPAVEVPPDGPKHEKPKVVEDLRP